MRIAIDARPLTENKAGIGQYTEKLILAMAAASPGDSFFLFSNREIFLAGRDNCYPIVKGRMMGNIWLQLVLPTLMKQYRIDLLHCPMFVSPLAAGVPTVVTVHDLVYRIFPETTHWRNRIVLQTLLPLSMKKAARVIAVSENTKKDVLDHYPENADKISVVYPGCDPCFQAPENPARPLLPGQADLPEHYILTVGTLEPRKNLVRLLQSFQLLQQRFPQLPQKLLVAGARGWRYAGVFAALKELGLENSVIFTDYLSHDELIAIYRGADLFVFPSLYEGFGLPPLEAMAMGIPVVSSGAGSLIEVVGDAARIIDPKDPEDICRGMAEVLLDCDRQRLMRQAGKKRAENFSWDKAARETLAIYREVLR